MVDTLAPKKIFSQRDLDKSLIEATPVGSSIMAPSTNVLDILPNIETQKGLSQTPQPDYVVDKNQVFNMMQNAQKQSRSMVAETNETVRSSEELTQEKQTGDRTEKEVPQGEALVMRPVEYAAKGVKDKEVSGPILVGEKGAELIVPTGEGKVSILDAKTTSGLMEVRPDLSEPRFKENENPVERSRAPMATKTKDEFVTIDRAEEDEKFLNYMKIVENNQLYRGNKSKLRHKSAEGGADTIGYGHKLTDKEIKANSVYGYNLDTLTIEQADDILKKDLGKAYTQLSETFGKDFINLDDRRKQMLLDFQFNLGGLKKFPKFTAALFAGDEKTMMNEYKRVFTPAGSDKPKPLTGRNKSFNDFFFDGMAKASLVEKPIRKAEKGAENVEIGKAEPAGFLFRSPATPDKPSGLEGILNFLFPKAERPPVGGAPEPKTESIVHRPTEDLSKEPFDLEKLRDQDSPYGINIDYFYDNYRDTMPEYTIKMRKGQDYIPTREEIEEESEDLYNRYRAFFDMTSLEYEDEDFEDAKRRYMDRDPYDGADKRRESLVEEFGPKILPET